MDFIKYMGVIFLFMLFVGGGVFILKDNIATENINVTGNIESDLTNKTNILTIIDDEFDDVYDSTRDMQDRVLQNEDQEDTSGFDYLITGGYAAITTITSTFGVIGGVAVEIQKVLHIPAFVIDIFMAIILVSVVISLIYLVFRFQPR